jgi:Glycoside-hydrolase family GH114
MKGRVVFGAHRVASFRATRRGGFHVKFVVPAGHSGQMRLVAEQVVRDRHGSLRRLRWAKIRFQIAARGSTIVPAGGAGAGAGGSPGRAPGGSPGGSPGSWWIPPKHLTWYWQLQGSIKNGEPVAAYDIDGFDNSASEVAALHGQGKHVICYVDVGTYEPGRPDSGKFPASVQGADVEGWPGEKWLDVRQLSLLEPIMTARFRVCKEKGFDAVEPDNMDGYENGTGFPITAQQQLAYDEWVAGEAHALGMAVFQKNDGEQAAQLVSHFDGALNEQCNQYAECSSYRPYLNAGKPVLNAEYGSSSGSFCAADNAAGIMGARFDLDLTGSTFEPCW